jgi:hypothetical protein
MKRPQYVSCSVLDLYDKQVATLSRIVYVDAQTSTDLSQPGHRSTTTMPLSRRSKRTFFDCSSLRGDLVCEPGCFYIGAFLTKSMYRTLNASRSVLVGVSLSRQDIWNAEAHHLEVVGRIRFISALLDFSVIELFDRWRSSF